MNAHNTTDSWQTPDADMHYPWTFNAMASPQSTVTQYNDLLERAATLYSILDNSRDSVSSSSDGSYRSSPETRETTNAHVMAEVKKAIPDKIERRREQNRSSQRAYRERKDRHQRELEQQISDWRQKHQKLFRSYSQQVDEVQRLKAQIEHLTSEISALQNGLPHLCGTLNNLPAEFDLVPFYAPESP